MLAAACIWLRMDDPVLKTCNAVWTCFSMKNRVIPPQDQLIADHSTHDLEAHITEKITCCKHRCDHKGLLAPS